MILQALAKYYERMVEDDIPDLEPIGYKRVAIPFIITLKKDGSITGIDDTRTGEGRRRQARPFIVPKVFDGSRTSDIEANLLWDKASYVFGVSPEGDPVRLRKQREKFLSTILDYFPNPDVDDGVKAVVNLLKHHQEDIKNYPEWEDIKTKDPFLAFRLEDEQSLICNRAAVREAIVARKKTENSEKGQCLVTGEFDDLTPLENPIKGLRGSGKGESHLVSFNESAYWSYGKSGKNLRHRNAPISKAASAAYVTAINYMQRDNSRQWLKIGDATTVFWAEKKHELEDWFADIFGEPAKENSDQDNAAIKALFKAPETGAKPVLDDSTQFYVLGLSPNAARIAIRFWYAGTVAEVEENIRQHFKDITIIRPPKQPEYLSLFRLLVSTALQGKSDNIQPNLAGDFMKAILAGIPYPETLLSSAIRRIRAEREVTYPRASLIKAVLVRKARYKNEKEDIAMGLDTENANTGYRLGRLFAVLEKIQEEASPGINATIRDRFYSSASSVPVTVFPHLMKLKNHHIAKLENKGRAVNFEKIISEIMDDIKDFPGHLSLDDQGRFAVGYYHQRQEYFKKKDNNQ